MGFPFRANLLDFSSLGMRLCILFMDLCVSQDIYNFEGVLYSF